MIAIVGASGNVGYSTSAALRKAGASVRAIVHDEAKAEPLRELGCEVTVLDLQDSTALASALRAVSAVQIVLPLRPQTPDPAADMTTSGKRLLEALGQVSLKRVLLISDLGAHVAEDIGMPSIFHKFEAEFKELGGQKIILRSAEYMHNWARNIPDAISTGTLPSFQDPVGKPQPTIFAADVGVISARLLLRPEGARGLEIAQAEGPRRYSANDVAAAIEELSGRPVVAKPIPRSEWTSVMAKMPPTLADLLTKANDAKNKGGLVDIEPNVGEVFHGQTEIVEGLRPLVKAK